MDYDAEPMHDEVNLIRLVRRLEKSVAVEDDWKASATQSQVDVWLKARSALQKVRYARKLVKNVELLDEDPLPKRVKRLNDTKIKLDKIEEYVKAVEGTSKPKTTRLSPILPTLPIPELPSEPSPPPYTEGDPNPDSHSRPLSPPRSDWSGNSPSPGLPSLTTAGLFIAPPDASAGISPTMITAAIPSLLPSNTAEGSSTSSYSRNLHSTSGMRHGTTALHEELSSQLEVMAAQLKRNAIHFSTSLANDRAVVEEAQEKLEGNHDVMQKERVRLRDHSGSSRSTTWLTMGIVTTVLLLFMVMVSFIRFT